MSTGYSTQPPTYPASGPQPGGFMAGVGVPKRSFWSVRDARIGTKLAIILFVPLVAVLALATLRLVEVGNGARDAGQVERFIKLSANVADVIQDMHAERMAAAAYLASGSADRIAYSAAIRQTDERIQTYITNRRPLKDGPAAVRDALNRIDSRLGTVQGIRQPVLNRSGLGVSEAVQRYGIVITDLAGYDEVLSQSAGDSTLAVDLRGLSAFTRAKASASDEEATAYAAQVAGEVGDEQRNVVIANQASRRQAFADFAQVASPAQRTVVYRALTGDPVNVANQISARLSRGERVEPAEITAALGRVLDIMRSAEQRLEQQTIDAAAAARRAASRRAAIEGTIMLLVLIIALAVAFVLGRSLNVALRRLREGALAVANRDLPDAVARLRDVRNLGDAAADDIVQQVRDPIQLANRDEIGQVAQAFNVVHREAVRIAAEQAALRTSVSTMFLNLARRSQSLVDRMIGELDQIERGEEDPKRLAQLFELDHLATRMRRNDENLLVLAGADSSAPRREDALLVDALRAAQSEVELYNRIEFGTVDTDISIAALAINDVVRLLAELLDNATRFSPPHTIVVAEARRIRDYVMIQIEDRGLGMSAEQMDILNRRLAEPPVVDVGAFRLMGLAVVGRLAGRYGIRVELRANLDGGTVAQVTLPNSIVVLPNRPIDWQVTPGRAPQLSSGPYGTETGLYGGRFSTVTATLPAIAPEPWHEAGRQHPSTPLVPSQRRPAPTSPAPAAPAPAAPGPASHAAPAHAAPGPAAPAPAEVPHPPAAPRPASPTPAVPGPASPGPAVPGPASPGPAWPGPAAEPASPSPSGAPIEATEPPVQPVRAEANGAITSPTVAYPSMRPASPDLQVAVGFLTPDGAGIPPRRRPAGPRPGGWGAALAGMPPPPPPPASDRTEDRSEAPIFLQMQANWFQGHDAIPEWSMPTAGYPPPPKPGSAGNGTSTGSAAAPATPAPVSGDGGPDSGGTGDRPAGAGGMGAGSNGGPPSATGGHRSAAQSPGSSDDDWRTVADEGWERAMAAAEPRDAGTTRSGLPKRVPQAQLVPGGVQSGSGNQNRRSPDEVRGLLSAYHRGVQRGRTASSAESAADAPGPKEYEQ